MMTTSLNILSLTNNSSFSQREDQAARCIQRSWRRSRSGLDCLRKSQGILEMPHVPYLALAKRLKPLLKRGLNNTARENQIIMGIASFLVKRHLKQRAICLPLFTSAGKGGMARCTFIDPTSNLSSFRSCKDRYCYMTPQAYLEFLKASKSPPKTKDDLDKLFSLIAEQVNLIPWRHTEDGCDARAQAAINLLILAGIPSASITQLCLVMTRNYRAEGAPKNWGYHIAAVVKLEDGSSWVMDPSLHPSGFVEPEQWIKLQRNNKFNNKVKECGDCSKSTAVLFSTLDCCLSFTIRHDQFLDARRKKLGEIRVVNYHKLQMIADLDALAQFRYELEKNKLYEPLEKKGN